MAAEAGVVLAVLAVTVICLIVCYWSVFTYNAVTGASAAGASVAGASAAGAAGAPSGNEAFGVGAGDPTPITWKLPSEVPNNDYIFYSPPSWRNLGRPLRPSGGITVGRSMPSIDVQHGRGCRPGGTCDSCGMFGIPPAYDPHDER